MTDEASDIVHFPPGTRRLFFIRNPAELPHGHFVTAYVPEAMAGLRFEEIFSGAFPFVWILGQEPDQLPPGVMADLSARMLAAVGAVAITYRDIGGFALTLLADGDP